MKELPAAARANDRAIAGAVWIGNVPVFRGSAESAIAECMARVRNGCGARIATANLDFLALARRNPQLAADLDASTLVIADGAPVAWLGRLAGAPAMQRLAGVDLVVELCRRLGADSNVRVAIYGSTPDIAGAAAGVIERIAPGVQVVAVGTPPFRPLTPAELCSDRAAIAAAAPDMVLVALGCPAQERRIAEWYPAVPGALWIGVGGTLDFFAGKRRRAPRWMQRAGLEWLARLVQDPRRLAARYLGRDLRALCVLTLGVLRARLVPGVRERRSLNGDSTPVHEAVRYEPSAPRSER